VSLLCDCGFDYDWYYVVESDERSACAEGKCYGCCGKINIGEEVRFMWRYEIDEEGEEINTKSLGRLCPVCAGLYDSLTDLGFCLSADWNFITESMDEYRSGNY